jgi:hypothetical protein
MPPLPHNTQHSQQTHINAPSTTQHSKQTHINAPLGFEPANPTRHCPQSHALDRTANGTVQVTVCVQQITDTCLDIQYSPSYLSSDKWQTVRKQTFIYLLFFRSIQKIRTQTDVQPFCCNVQSFYCNSLPYARQSVVQSAT